MSMAVSHPAQWSRAQRVAFRFFFAYFALYFFPLPSGLANPDAVSTLTDGVWHKLVPWVASHLFHLQITTFSNGSGDTTYDYLRVFCMVVLAVVATVIWSLLDRQRKDYRTLHDWARLWLRYALGLSMLTYGAVKVIKLQMPTPGYGVLSETYGESSPMRLLWTFMGFSTGYSFFAGASEVAAALFLFFRRTTTLGALLAAAVMSNVVMLNFCYDVPVKLGSSHLLLLALFLLAPDLSRLANLLLFNRTVEPVDRGPHLARRWMRWTGLGLKVSVIGFALVSEFGGALRAYAQFGNPGQPKVPEGWYKVSSFQEDGKELPALATDGRRWNTFVLLGGYVRLWGFDRSTRLLKVEGNPTHGRFALLALGEGGEPVAGAAPVAQMEFHLSGDGQGLLEGTYEGRALKVAMARQDSRNFPLMKRGFHWISEFPYNR
jgi:hypothetical protein